MQKSTQELLNNLKSCDDIQKYLDENKDEIIGETLHDYLNDLQQQRGLKTGQIASRSGQGEYVYKIMREAHRNPGRDVLLAIAIGMSLDMAETQLLLRIARVASLDPRNSRDSVIIYAINNGSTMDETNRILDELGKETFKEG